jgi:predicted nuclease of predicted toxin-antitoxin system
MKFLIDMPLSPELALWLAHQSHDAVHALELGLARASDEVILEHARREQRGS